MQTEVLDMTDSMQTLQAIIRSAGDAIITADARGNIVTWNPTAERMFGWTEAEAVGEPLTLIIPERFQAEHDDGITRVVATGETRVIGHTIEVGGLRKDGSELPVELSLETWLTNGERFFTGIIRDITERNEAELALRRANEALAKKNKMLEGLSAKLAKYLSRQVYDSIFEGRTEVRVMSYRKRLTVFFSDIQGFTEMTDRMEPEPISQLLNGYLSDMSGIALEHGGTVDKFIGDAIMIFFGDPETRGEVEDATACVRMAIKMRDRVAELKDEWQRQSGSVELHVRMGIHTGYCTVGNFGSEDRLDYTIVGKEVNAASRLESTAQPDQIQISHVTHELIKQEMLCAPVGEVNVKGLAYPIKTYKVVGLVGDDPLAATPGFSLDIDPSKLAPAEADAAKEALRSALSDLEGHTHSEEGTN
jgi:PAS domain S-box-containing protein